MSQSKQQSASPVLFLLERLQSSRRHLVILVGILLLITILIIGAGISYFIYPKQWKIWLLFGSGMLLLGTLAIGITVYLLKRQVIQPLTQLQAELQHPEYNPINQDAEATGEQHNESYIQQRRGVDKTGSIANITQSDLIGETRTKNETGQLLQIDGQDYYRQLVEFSPDGIVIHSEGKIVFINQAGAKLLKAASPEQLIGKSIMDFVHPDEREIVQQRVQRVGAEGKEVPLVEEKLIRLDKTVVDVGVTRFPFVYQNKPAVQLVIHDITERKRTAAEIIQRNRELTILQSTGVAITSSLDLRYVLDTVVQEMVKLFEVESCAIFEWNQTEETVCMIARYGSAGWWDPKAPAQIRRLADYPLIKWVLDEQIPQQMTIDQTNIDPAEFAYMQGSDIKSRMILPMIFQKRVIGLAELEDRRVERTFSYQEISLAKLLANQAANAIENARLFEQAQQEIAERKQAEAALEEERALLAQRVAERTAELSKVNAELARTARLKDEFLANMSHELRTPLNGILGSSEILQTGAYGPVNEKQLKYLRNVEESGRHLLSLINDILDLSKSEVGRLELEIKPISVKSVCQASLRLTKQLAHKKRLKVFQTLDSTATRLPADERRLKQILVNLLSNAIKFTPEGGKIGLEVVGDEAQQVVHFAVWDTGIGIAQEDMQWLFQPFVQLDSSLARQQGGTGLGLSLVSRLVELHGGGISVESEVGQGSRFTVSLPCPPAKEGVEEEEKAKSREREQAPVSTPTPHPSPSMDAPLILLAEDNEDNINTFSDYLQLQGYRVIVARNGEEALERVKEEKPDVILMDVQMPGMDGLEATRRLRANSELANVPIIALTALAMPGDRERCLEAGANEYLSKPVSLKRLVEVIEAQLSELEDFGNEGLPQTRQFEGAG
jgi:PAS domain S-box-containing protein